MCIAKCEIFISPKPNKIMEKTTEVPRRNRIDLNTTAELAIIDAIKEVELLGEDTRLTEIVAGLSEIKSKLSDYIGSQEAEEELPNKGEVCWGSIADNLWRIGHFMCKDGDYFILSTQNDDRVDFSKHPKITTKNPYEDVSEMENTDREPQIGDMCFFWSGDKPNCTVFAELVDINTVGKPLYKTMIAGLYENCSFKNPLTSNRNGENSIRPTE